MVSAHGATCRVLKTLIEIFPMNDGRTWEDRDSIWQGTLIERARVKQSSIAGFTIIEMMDSES